MTPFLLFQNRYTAIRAEFNSADIAEWIENQSSQLNNIFMAGFGMSTLFLRMGAVIQVSEKLNDGDTSNDFIFIKQVLDNLRETLPSDTNWKNLWYAAMQSESKWDLAIPRDGNRVSMLDRFVTFRNKYVHQHIRLIPEHAKEVEKGVLLLDEMAGLITLFQGGEVLLKEGHYYWKQGGLELDLYPFVQKGERNELPYLFQGLYENKSKAKFINTIYGDETLPQINSPLDETFKPMQQAMRGGAGQVFDHRDRLQYYLDCFVGREREVRSVLNWINLNSSNNVLPIYSEAGMGKGALISCIIDALHKENVPVMYHFCGSGMANSLHAVLYHFILQGKKMPGMSGAGVWKVDEVSIQRKMERLPSRYPDTIHLFQTLLSDCYSPSKKYEGQPLVIVIDGLDEAAVANSQLRISDWFYSYNEKDEPEEDWKSPKRVKWIFTYRSMSDQTKDGFRLDGRFDLEINELVQPLQGLSESAVLEALGKFDVSGEFVQTVMERGSVR